MRSLTVRVVNADRMMTFANAAKNGIELAFADGSKGLIPYSDIPEIKALSKLSGIELPNPYLVVLRNEKGETVELPWDFVRHYCDASYRLHVESVSKAGRQALGARVRQLRQAANTTQEALAAAAGIGRVTLVRIENGEQSPRFETLIALARALGRPVQELLVESEA